MPVIFSQSVKDWNQAMSEHVVNLSKEGRILIPAHIRSQLDLKPGQALTLSVMDGELRLSSRVNAIRRMQKRLAGLRDPDESMVNALIAERRDAAKQE